MTTSKKVARLVARILASIAIGLCVNSLHAATLNIGDIIVGDFGDGNGTTANTKVLKVDPTTGNRTLISSEFVGSGPLMMAPQSIAIGASGNIIVMDAGLDAVLRIDPATGARTVVSSNSVGTGTPFSSSSGVAIGPTGTIYASDFGITTIFEIDPANGNRTIVASSSVGTGATITYPAGMTFDAAGDLLFVDFDDPYEIIRLDLDTLARTRVSGSGMGTGPAFGRIEGGITVAADGTIYATVSGGTSTSAIFGVNATSGDRVVTSKLGIGAGDLLNLPYQLDEDANGQLIVANGFGQNILSVDPTTGNRTVLSSSIVGTGSVDFNRPFGLAIVPVPEPSTALLAVMSLGAVLACAWRRNKRH